MSSCQSGRSYMACIVSGETETGAAGWTAATPLGNNETFNPSYTYVDDVNRYIRTPRGHVFYGDMEKQEQQDACIILGGTESETEAAGWTAATPLENNETFIPSYVDGVEISKSNPWSSQGYFEVISISRPFPIRIKSYLQEVWLTVESALEESDMTCSLDLEKNVVEFSTDKVPDLDNILKAREIFQLLELNVPACQAITILKKGGDCPEFEMNMEQFVELTSKFDQMEIEKSAGPSLNEDGNIGEANEVISIIRRVPKCIEYNIKEAVPTVNYALEQNGIPCTLKLIRNYNLGISFLKFSTTMIEDLDSIVMARELLLLLGLKIPAFEALRILIVRQWTIILTGDIKGGLCSDFGIQREQYVEREKLLLLSLKELRRVTGCIIHIKDDFVIAIGTLQGVKLVKKIVEDCIVHNVPPATRIRTITRTSTITKKFKTLRLCEP